MGNSLRCCLSCVLPCGALDLIRIVHLSGQVEVISEPVTAGEILRSNPDHVLSKPCSESVDVRRVLILSPEDELKRGGIYFLIPDSSLQGHHSKRRHEEHGYSDQLFSDVLPEKKLKSSRRNRRSSGNVSSSIHHMECICEE